MFNPWLQEEDDTVDPRYLHPPLIETVTEFRFLVAGPWDTTIPGLVFQGLRDPYPRREPVALLETEVSATPEGAQQRTSRVERVRFLSPDGSRMVQVGEGLLAVNRLSPYGSWEEYLPTVDEAVVIYRGVARPAGIGRVGLRFINRVHLDPSARIADYFAFYPQLPDLPAGLLRGFITGAQWSYEDDRDALRVQLSEEVSSDPSKRQFLFDLDYGLSRPEGILIDSYRDWLANAHARIQAAFEAGITDNARAMFGQSENESD